MERKKYFCIRDENRLGFSIVGPSPNMPTIHKTPNGNHITKLETICSLAKQDLKRRNEENILLSSNTRKFDCVFKDNTNINNELTQNVLPFMRVSKKVKRFKEDPDMQNEKAGFQNSSTNIKDLSFQQEESEKFATMYEKQEKRTVKKPVDRCEHSSFVPSASFATHKSQSADSETSTIRMTPDRNELPHPSKLRPKKRKLASEKSQNSRHKSAFNINSHLQQLKKKCQQTYCPGLKPMSSGKVKRIGDSIQPFTESLSSAFERVPTRSKFVENHDYMSLYTDAASGSNENLWTSIGGGRDGSHGREDVCYTDQTSMLLSPLFARRFDETWERKHGQDTINTLSEAQTLKNTNYEDSQTSQYPREE